MVTELSGIGSNRQSGHGLRRAVESQTERIRGWARAAHLDCS
jgi:hypothetical protein